MTAHFKIADPALIQALADQVDAGRDKPGYADIAKALEMDPSNTRRAIKQLAEAGLMTIEPLSVSEMARALATVWTGGTIGEGTPTVPWSTIKTSPFNPRKHFDPEALQELANGIHEKGVLQNLVVRPHPTEDGKYEIAAGERRYRAIGLLVEAGQATSDYAVPVQVRQLSDQELLLIALAENTDRVDPHPMEEAQGIAAFRELRVKEILAETFPDDPDAAEKHPDTFAPEVRRAAGIAAQEAASAMGKTVRWVELRARLGKDLAPDVSVAFLAGRINLAQARAIVTAPAELQSSSLEAMENGYSGWGTGDGVLRMLRSGGMPASEAAFDVAEYDGPTMEDAETGEAIMLDAGKVTSLQMKALRRRVKELKRDGVAWIKQEQRYSYEYPSAEDDDPQDKVGVFLYLDNRNRLREEQAIKRQDRERAFAAANKPKKTAKSGDEEPVAQPFGKRHWLQACTLNTARLRTAIAAAPATFSQAIMIIAFLPRDLQTSGDAPFSWIHTRQSWGDDSKIPSGATLAERIGALEAHEAFGVKDNAVLVRNPVIALMTLMDLKPAQLAEIFTAAVAAQCAIWPGYHATGGCNDFTQQLVDLMDGRHQVLPAFEMDEAYLKPFTIHQRRAIARACGIGDDADNMPAKSAPSIDFILKHPDRDHGWLPPELAFAPESSVSRNVSAQLAAAFSPAPAIAA
ncbi:ParB/RepB/Spo0J family partition protein [Maricaulis maris]|uniref:ParB/RepB/Spo0J family partition protein n=1 Tax=Maricaulis maris TaxID=74318 RepID=UPI003B8DC4CF